MRRCSKRCFRTILSHYGVSKVLLRRPLQRWAGSGSCHRQSAVDRHSERGDRARYSQPGRCAGRLDLQSRGQRARTQLGSLTPAVQSMEIANVQQLRTQWDPIFQNAKIPFYTLSGNTYRVPDGPADLPHCRITGPILATITNLRADDGKSRNKYAAAKLPMQRRLSHLSGNVAAHRICHGTRRRWPINHYLLRMGDNSFPISMRASWNLTNEQPGVTQVATGGFGDQHNTWAWSMAWYNEHAICRDRARDLLRHCGHQRYTDFACPSYPPRNRRLHAGLPRSAVAGRDLAIQPGH